MTLQYDDSYLGQLRKVVGKQKIIAIGARAVIQDKAGRVLLVRRSDNNTWVMPAGSIELNESILDCLKREVKEETGLEVINVTVMAIYSDPRHSFVTAYGDPYQMFAVVFLVNEWQGTLLSNTDETTDARFFGMDELPEILELYRETLEDFQNFNGQVILK